MRTAWVQGKGGTRWESDGPRDQDMVGGEGKEAESDKDKRANSPIRRLATIESMPSALSSNSPANAPSSSETGSSQHKLPPPPLFFTPDLPQPSSPLLSTLPSNRTAAVSDVRPARSFSIENASTLLCSKLGGRIWRNDDRSAMEWKTRGWGRCGQNQSTQGVSWETAKKTAVERIVAQ